jgi:hypothetical protein
MTRPCLAFALALAAGLAVTGCNAAYENRIESSLANAGLSQPVAACIAERMVDQLSKSEIRAIGRLGEKAKDRPRGMSAAEFLAHHRGELEPRTYATLTRAGVVCAITA